MLILHDRKNADICFLHIFLWGMQITWFQKLLMNYKKSFFLNLKKIENFKTLHNRPNTSLCFYHSTNWAKLLNLSCAVNNTLKWTSFKKCEEITNITKLGNIHVFAKQQYVNNLSTYFLVSRLSGNFIIFSNPGLFYSSNFAMGFSNLAHLATYVLRFSCKLNTPLNRLCMVWIAQSQVSINKLIDIGTVIE